MRWIFSVFSASPVVGSYSNVSAQQRDAANQQTAELMQRLLLVDCKGQTIEALKYEGASAIETSFGVLGQVAVRGLMGDASVMKEMEGFGAKFDEKKMSKLFEEAGLKSEAASASGAH